MINTFASSLLKVDTVDEAVWSVAKQACAKLGYQDCVIYLVDNDGKYLVQRAAHGPKNPIAHNINHPIRLKFGEGICGSVAQNGIGEIINDTSMDKRYKVDDSSRLSEITVPIISDGKVIGVIDSEHPNKNHFTEEDLEILETIASMVSVKIGQAKAQEKLIQSKQDLEIRVEEKTAELRDTIAKLQVSNELINKSNVEKEIMLKEIHHRVKNNLQIISSLLSLHANRSSNIVDQKAFYECQDRIRSMSLIHDRLYTKGNLSEIDAKTYIEELVENLVKSYRANEYITTVFDVQKLFFDIQVSVPFGLILNEIIVNSLKHAFRENQGEIRIKLSAQGNKAVLEVSDNGKGFKMEDLKKSMGFELIDALTTQLEGELSINSNSNGTKTKIEFTFYNILNPKKE